MEYNRILGRELMQKYLNSDKLQKRLEHSIGVAEFAFKVANKIKTANPELKEFDPEFVGFLGYIHDIGYSIADGKHEVHTINILVEKENIPSDIARFAMHGQLYEQFANKEKKAAEYTPKELEGMVLTYADMSVRTGGPIAIKKRAKEIIKRINAMPLMPDELKKDIKQNLNKALPRFERYEKIVLTLAGINSAEEF